MDIDICPLYRIIPLYTSFDFSVITGVAQLPVAHAKSKGTANEGQVTFGHIRSHVTTTKKKAREKAGHAQNLLPIRTASGQKAIPGQIWRNFRLRMRRTYFRTHDSYHFRSCD